MIANKLTTFRVTFTGWDSRSRCEIKRKYRVRALDSYDAIDRLDARHGLSRKYLMRRFQFGRGRAR